MTTDIRAESVALLAEALVMVGIAHENVSSIGTAEQWLPDYDLARRALAASPVLARRLAFATAWEMAEAALPEGYEMEMLSRGTLGWRAVAWRSASDTYIRGMGDTPTLALLALVAKLTEATR